MEENNANINNTQPKKCDGHCETCNINQRTYCAAQIAYYNQQEINAIKAAISDFLACGKETIITRNKSEENENISVQSEPTASGVDE